MSDKMREEFEAWARSMSMDLEYRNIPGVGQFYECPRTLLALEAWQASRSELVIELPSDQCIEIHGYSPKATKLYCRKAIEAAGVKYK